MYKKKFFRSLFFIGLLFFFISAIYSAESTQNTIISSQNSLNKTYNNSPNLLTYEYKTKNITLSKNTSYNKIKNIFQSKNSFKSGDNFYLKVFTDNSIQTVFGAINKNKYSFKKSTNNCWYCKVNTKKFKSNNYNFKIKAIDKNYKNYYKHIYFTVDNTPPKIFSLFTNEKTTIAGDPFTVTLVSDNSSKKAIAVINGKKFSLKSFSNTVWASTINIDYRYLGNIKIKVYVSDNLGNIAKKTTYFKAIPRYVSWNESILTNKRAKISYPNPKNDYEKSVKILSRYATVYEGFAGDKFTLGITYKEIRGRSVRYDVIIAYKDPFVVYHELAHVLRWGWSERNCDWYAYNKTGYWIL